MASADYPLLVLEAVGGSMDSAGHWEARRKAEFNRRYAQSIRSQTESQGENGMMTTTLTKSSNISGFVDYVGMTGRIEDVLHAQGIESPADFDNFSFAELVELGVKPAHVKRIKMARLEMTGSAPEGSVGMRPPSRSPSGRALSPEVYGAASPSSGMRTTSRARTADAAAKLRQDFVTMGRVDKAAMDQQVWGQSARAQLQHPQTARSNVYLASGPASRDGLSQPFSNSSSFREAVSDINQSNRGNVGL